MMGTQENKMKKQTPKYIIEIEKIVDDFRKEHKCENCDGSPDSECDNCYGIGYVPISPPEVELLLIKYHKEKLASDNDKLCEELVEAVRNIAVSKNYVTGWQVYEGDVRAAITSVLNNK